MWLRILFLSIICVRFGSSEFCSQFTDCESCAGRHHVTFEQCTWCPAFNSCVPPSKLCRSGYRTVFDCPRLMTHAYNETFARNVAAPLIAAAQGSHDQLSQCLAKLVGKFQLWRRFSVLTEDGKERPDAFVAVDFTSRAVIASFSSVAGGSKLLYNRFNAEFFTNRQSQFENTNGLVNRFIYDSWFKLWYVLDMENTLRQVLSAHPDFDLWLFGHAVGGAKAEMAAVAAITKNLTTSDKVKLITFGATRLGDLSFVEMIETMIPYRFRIVHDHDMVVRYPKEFEGEWTPPHHHRYEVWYPNDMMEGAHYLVCLGAEDPQCSARLTPWQLRAEDNDMYFERSMERWSLSGCDEKDKAPKSLARVRNSHMDSPIYDVVALRTAKPYKTTTVPPSLAPTHSTPRITLPPKHLAPPTESSAGETTTVMSTVLQTTTTTVVTTTTVPPVTSTTISSTTTSTTEAPKPPTTTAVIQKNFTLPWWYTTAPWSSTTPVPLSSTSPKEWDDGKGPISITPKKFTTFGKSGDWWNDGGNHSFRDNNNNSFRSQEKSSRFRSFAETFGETALVEGTHPRVLQPISETQPRLSSDRVPKNPRRKQGSSKHSNKIGGQKNSQHGSASEVEGVLALVDREAHSAVSRNRTSNPKAVRPWRKIRRFYHFSATTKRPSAQRLHKV